MIEKKKEIMKKVEMYEEIILELEEWTSTTTISKVAFNQVGEISTDEQRRKMIKLLEKYIEDVKLTEPKDDKLYLSEIVRKEKIEFESNSLILAPVGSGKSTFIKELISRKASESDKVHDVLMLVSNTTLKESISSDKEEIKKKKANRIFTTKNKSIHGEGNYKIHLMSYAELGSKIKSNNEFIEKFTQIFCDEIHSLPIYQSFENSVELSHAIKYLFGKHEGQDIFYLTATNEGLKDLEKRQPGITKHIKIFNFLDHPEIKQYMALSEYKINHIDQIRSHLKARINSFNYFKYKGLAFSRTIAGQKRIEEIAIEEGFKPLVLWSVNNTSKEHVLSEEQIRARQELIDTETIPDGYNFLIINSSMQEGWNLKDPKVKLAIINSTNETEKVQSLGRIRKDIDVVIYRVDRSDNPDLYIKIRGEYIDVPLTTTDKENLARELDMKDGKGRLIKWPTIKRTLQKQGFQISEGQKTIDGKRSKVSTITI